MNNRSGQGAPSSQDLRVRLEALAGVRRVLVDDAARTVWLICEPDADRPRIEKAARNAAQSAGTDPASLTFETAVLEGFGERRRVRLDGVDRYAEVDRHVRVCVTLEWRGEIHAGEAVGEEGEALEVKTAATATLRALEDLIGGPIGVKPTGAKQYRAFDTDLLIVSLIDSGPPRRQFVGTVILGPDPRHSAAAAVLNALNRILGKYLFTPD